MGKYPEIFDERSLGSQLFYKFYAQVCTRCFGWGLPSTAMIPMADNCNHSDVSVVQEILNHDMHLVANRESNYFTSTKYMNDYSLNYEDSEYKDDSELVKKVTGFYNKQNYDANK